MDAIARGFPQSLPSPIKDNVTTTQFSHETPSLTRYHPPDEPECLAQQKTVNIVTVNNPDMITLETIDKVRRGQSEHQIELAGVGGEHHAPTDHDRCVHRGRASTLCPIGLYEAPIFASGAG